MRIPKTTTLLLSGLLALAACTSTPATTTEPSASAPESPPESMAPESPAMTDEAASADIMSDAANLRTDLDYLLGEHLILAAKATGAALGGRTDQFTA
ncbi:MAG: hypothetical protein ACRDFY_06510, partial [Candidatus Limnocylindria bacterium]